MKKTKIFALVIFVILALSVVLTACTGSKTITPSIRWEDESYTYNISLIADDESKLSTVYNEITFYNNFQLTTKDTDQIKPTAVEGTVTTTLTNSDSKITYTLKQVLTETLSMSNNTVKKLVEQIDALPEDQKSAYNMSKSDNLVTLTSTTEWTTVFNNEGKQLPISSKRTVVGYYVGKTASELTNVTTDTTYEGTKATVKKTDKGQTTENTYTVPYSTFIDVTQMYVYARSLDQSIAYQSTPTTYAYDPITNTTVLIGFTLQKDYKAKLNFGGEIDGYSVVNAMAIVTADNTPLAVLYNNPSDKDSILVSSGKLNSYTTVKFQSSHYVYELDYQSMSEEVRNEFVSQLQYKPDTTDK